jgi:FkbM family methyltransferase
MIERVGRSLRSGYRQIRWLSHRLRGFVPSFRVSRAEWPLKRLGSGYGGWTLVDTPQLAGSTIVSCGLGEDASFDVEFVSAFNAKAVIVDPTPRAVEHFKAIIERVGEKRSQPYAPDGEQPAQAYDLFDIRVGQLLLCEKALWNKTGSLRFFTPVDPAHVSHSIVNFQNNYSTDTSYINVPATTIDKVLSEFGIDDLQLLKLDIEGAEIEVIVDMLSKGICPHQVLVEYDELLVPSKLSRARVELAHGALEQHGYALVHREHTNFTYLRGPGSAA